MKSKLLFALLSAIFYWDNCANAQVVNIPDPLFKAALVGNSAINTNGDTSIQVSEATAYTGGIFVGTSNIYNLTGIEAFTGLTTLDCSETFITSLNLSANTALEYLDCDNGNLTSLDVSSNSALTLLYCYNSALTSLNLKNGNNTNMTLWADGNSLTCIQVDDPIWAITNWTSNVDPGTSFSANCNCSIQTSLKPQAICENNFYYFNGHTYTIAGNYNDTLQSYLGCDSIIVTQLSVNPLPTVSFVITNGDLGLGQICLGDQYFNLIDGLPKGGYYSGIGIFNDSIINLGDSIGFNLGDYQYIYTYSNGICSDTASATYHYDICEGIKTISSNDKFSIYPNPSTGILNLQIDHGKWLNENLKISIFNIIGECVYQSEISTSNLYCPSGQAQFVMDFSKRAKGIYSVQITDANKNTVNKKIVIQ